MKPFWREAGAGPAVLCLHSNASACGQWRALMERLAGRFRVIAVDSYGAGKSPDWPPGSPGWIDDEMDLLAELLRRSRWKAVGFSAR